jgi:hypothetical protein
MSEVCWLPEWNPPVVSDEWKAKTLEEWQRGCLSVSAVKIEIKSFSDCLKRDSQRLSNMKQYLSEHSPGFDEWIEQQAYRLEFSVTYWDERISYLKWLLKQKR